MAHKVHPKIFRIGTVLGWDSKWFNRKEYKALVRQDAEIRVFLRKALREAAVDRIEIERASNRTAITIHSGKPGFVIGRGGTGIEDLKKKLIDRFFKKNKKTQLQLNVIEITQPNLSANITAQNMIAELERRMPFRRILKQTVDRAQKAGALGIKVMVSGRLNGAEIARREALSWGSVPLQNLRADIDYASDFARTLFGTIGVKVWIYRGEVFGKKDAVSARPAAAPAERPQGARPPSRAGVGAKRPVRA